jgi:hypothetical protein
MAYTLQDYYNTNDDIDEGIGSNQWRAQSFTANQTYTLTRVGLKLRDNGVVNTVTVGIRSSLTGPDLDYVSFNGDTELTDTAAWYYMDFTGAVELTSGNTYYIVVRTNGAASALVTRMDQTSPTYAGGSRWYSTNSGASWNQSSTIDWMFETYSGTAGPSYVELTASDSITIGGSADLTYFEYVEIAASDSFSISGTAALTYTIAAGGDYTNIHETKFIIVAGSDAIWVSD